MIQFFKKLLAKRRERKLRHFLDGWKSIAEQWDNEELHVVHLDVPLSRFLGGTEDEFMKGLEAVGDDGRPVKHFPIGATSCTIRYPFIDRDFDLPFQTDDVATSLMVEVCCGLLVHRILPKRNDFLIPPELDFRLCRLKRISWNPSQHAWRLFCSFEEQG